MHNAGQGEPVKGFDEFRLKRRQVYENLFSAKWLCIFGFIIMPSFLFNPVTLFRVFQFLLFWFLSWLTGKKNNPLITIFIITGIVVFNLIIPYGEVIYSIGVFKITAGALTTGIHRAVTLEGLLMLSRVTIRRDLKIPGAFGELIGESFRIFAVIMDRKQLVTRKNFIADIDRLMLELSGDERSGDERQENAASGVTAPATKPTGFVILAFIAILSWLPWLFVPGLKQPPI
jgi:heptaprenyl diphosphate synthase